MRIKKTTHCWHSGTAVAVLDISGRKTIKQQVCAKMDITFHELHQIFEYGEKIDSSFLMKRLAK